PRPGDDGGSGGEPILVPGNPVKMSGVAEGPETRFPWLGEHTDEVLAAELGLSPEELARLRSDGGIGERLRRQGEAWPERPAAKQHEREMQTTVAAATVPVGARSRDQTLVMRYVLELARTGLRLRHKRAHALLVRDFVSWLRVEFLGTAARVGLLAALASGPRRLDHLADDLAGVDRAPVGSLLQRAVPGRQ